MNKLKIKSSISIMIISLLMLTTATFAQQGNGNGKGNRNGKSANYSQSSNYHKMNKGENMLNRIPDITEEQKTQIMKLRTDVMKQMLSLNNQLSELKAHQRTLCTAPKTDMDAINKQIDKQMVVKTDIKKLRVKTNQDIRALLTDDQRIFFDTHNKMGNGNRNGNRRGHNGRNCR